MSETKRESGYYWVRDEITWYVALYAFDKWTVSNSTRKFTDAHFIKINETKLQPPA